MQRHLFVSTFILIATVFAYSMSEKAKDPKPLTPSPKVAGKSLGYFQTVLWSEDNGNGDLTINAKVVARQKMNNAEFEWKTPEGLLLRSGDPKGETTFTAGQEHVFSIVVEKEKVKDQDQFFFFVYEDINGEKHGTSQIYIHSLNDVSKSQQKSKQKPPKYFE